MRDFPQIREAYDRNGGAPVLGRPAGPAVGVRNGRGFIQPFEGNSGQPAAIFAHVGAQAYVVRGGFYALHNFLGPKIGWPIKDEYEIRVKGLGINSGQVKRYQKQRFDTGVEFLLDKDTGLLKATWNMSVIYSSRPPPKTDTPWYIRHLKAYKYVFVDAPSIGAGYVMEGVTTVTGTDNPLSPEQTKLSDDFFGIDREEGFRNPYGDDTN